MKIHKNETKKTGFFEIFETVLKNQKRFSFFETSLKSRNTFCFFFNETSFIILIFNKTGFYIIKPNG